MSVTPGIRHIAAYPLLGSESPAWQGVVVVEPGDYRWRCPHAHEDHEEAVLCAAGREPDTPRAR